MADEEEEYPADGGWSYARLLENLGIQTPYRWIAGLGGVARTTLEVPVRPEYSPPFLGPASVNPTVVEGGLYDGAEDAPVPLNQLFDKLSKRRGIERPEHLRDLLAARLRWASAVRHVTGPSVYLFGRRVGIQEFGQVPKNAHCAYNASGYPEDRCMAGDLAAEPSPAGSVDENR